MPPTGDDDQLAKLSLRLQSLNDTLAEIDRRTGTRLIKSKTPVVSSEEKTAPIPVDKSKIQASNLDLVKVRQEVAKLVVGQDKTVQSILCSMLSNGHVLLEAVPGVAKTLLLRTLAKVSGCQCSRIQFTVDLLPTDITGITTYDPKRESFTTLKGPIFAHFVLADEINRAPPKTQSALLEAMQERQVTIGDTTFHLERPFFVMATQNPIENTGTYQLPEAQVDRFMFKIRMTYPTKEDEKKILHQNITLREFDSFPLQSILTPEKILMLQEQVSQVHLSDEMEEYIVRIIEATRHPKTAGLKLGKYLEYGGSPRASISLFIASKAMALMHGQGFVTPQHVRDIMHPVLRHRLMLSYEAQTDNVTTDDIIDELIKKIPVP